MTSRSSSNLIIRHRCFLFEFLMSWTAHYPIMVFYLSPISIYKKIALLKFIKWCNGLDSGLLEMLLVVYRNINHKILKIKFNIKKICQFLFLKVTQAFS